MRHPRILPVILAATLTMSALVAFTPTGNAQTASDWTNEVVPTGGVSPGAIYSDLDGDRLGVAFGTATDTDVGFSIRSSAGTWTNKQTDLTGVNNRRLLALTNYGSGEWAILVASVGTAQEIYYSSDDGTTWTLGAVITTGAANNHGDITWTGTDNNLIVIYDRFSGTGFVEYRKSTDGGATVSSATRMDDNCGTNTGCTATAQVLAGGGNSIAATTDANYVALWQTNSGAQASKLFDVVSDDGGFFWSVPYTTNLGTTPDPYPGSSACAPAGTVSSTRAVEIAVTPTRDRVEYAYGQANPTNQYVCITQNGVEYAVPSTAPATAVVLPTNGIPYDINSGGGIVAFDSGSDLLIYYKSMTASPTLSRTVTGANPSGAVHVSLSTTSAFVLYTDNGQGGRMELETSTIYAAGATGTPGFRFCADPTITPAFGYEYNEGVGFNEVDDPNLYGESLQDYFTFEGDNDNSAYLGKGFTVGSQSFSVVARLEAGSDGASTLFRAAFTTGSGGSPSVTTKGDGTDGGNFDTHAQARFLEDGSDWVIGIYQNVAGTGLVQRGASVRYGNPTNPTTFNVTVDSREGINSMWVKDSLGAVIINRTLGGGLFEATYKDQWFVGKGATGAINAATALDDNTDSEQNSNSTCIYDNIGTGQVTGSEGSAPGSEVPDDPSDTVTSTSSATCTVLCVSSATVPEGFTVSGFNALLGLLLVAGVGGGFYFIDRRSNYAHIFGAVGAVVGFFLAYFFGLFPLWVLLALILLLAAVVVLGFRRGLGA